MFRTVIELLLTFLVIMVARSLLGGIMKGVFGASQGTPPPDARSSKPVQEDVKGPQIAGNLHRDPVCGTFVAESTPFRRQSGSDAFYYCSSQCREKHVLAAR